MIINRERDSCFGRGFSSSGTILNYLWDPNIGVAPKGWIDRAIAAVPISQSVGGAEWHVIEDGTSNAEPYIVVSNHSAANVAANPNRFDEPHKIVKITQSTTGSQITLDAYLWWDAAVAPSVGTGYGHWAGSKVLTIDDGPFIYDFRGGPQFLSIGANNNTSWSFFVLGDWYADANTKWFPYPNTIAGAITNSPAQGTDVVIEFGSDGAAQTTAGLFEANMSYYLTDYNGVSQAEYVKVLSVNTSSAPYSVTIEELKNISFAIGSVLAAYVHRFYSFFTNENGASGTPKDQVIPYCSNTGNIYYTQKLNNIGNEFTPSQNFLDVMKPDDEGNYAVEQPYVGEWICSGSTAEMNNTFGKCVGMWMSSTNGMTQMQTARTIEDPPGNPLNFIYMERRDNFAFLVPDYDSNT